MRKIITFLGKYPRETTYCYGGETYAGRVFAEALRQFVDYDEILVFTTDVAAETTWPVLEELGDPRIRAVPIPTGNDADELWTLFDCLTQEVADGDTVIFDITHGLRSIPFLVFLAAAYLKEARDVTIEKIFYGAYELGQPAPVIELSRFVGLLDWTTATNQFIETGDARQLVGLLETAHNLPWRQQNHYERSELPSQLKVMGGRLRALSQALRLARPEEVMSTAAELGERLERVRSEVERWAKPFSVLLDRTERDYSMLAMQGDPRSPDHIATGLSVQRELVRWYVVRRQYVQAITLAREWLVSYTAFALGWNLINDRGMVESALYAGAEAYKGKKPLPVVLKALAQAEALVKLWNDIPDLRNDIAHVGMRPQPRPVDSIIKAAQSLPEQLAVFSL
jgi:CRISPR-associated DxTHG motif protein